MERYLSPEEVVELIPGMTKTLLASMRFRGVGPAYVKASPKKVVYKESTLRAWLDSREITRTDQQVPA